MTDVYDKDDSSVVTYFENLSLHQKVEDNYTSLKYHVCCKFVDLFCGLNTSSNSSNNLSKVTIHHCLRDSPVFL